MCFKLRNIIYAVAAIATATVGLQLPMRAAGQSAVSPDIAVLQAEVARLKSLVPSQSHAMADVGYDFTNLWFAGQKKNWPLAQFNWEETRSHLRWAVSIVPSRKDPQGNLVELEPILASIEMGPLQQVGDAIRAKDIAKFTAAYKQMLDNCHSCHVAAGKPYLRPHIPEQPAAPILDFDPEP